VVEKISKWLSDIRGFASIIAILFILLFSLLIYLQILQSFESLSNYTGVNLVFYIKRIFLLIALFLIIYFFIKLSIAKKEFVEMGFIELFRLIRNWSFQWLAEKLNVAFVIALSILLVFFGVGIGFYKAFTDYSFPLNITFFSGDQDINDLFKSNLNESPSLVCLSDNLGLRDFVEREKFLCKFGLIYKNNYTSFLSKHGVTYIYKNGSSKSEYTGLPEGVTIQDLKQVDPLYIEVDRTTEAILFEAYFKNKENESFYPVITYYRMPIKRVLPSLEEYYRKKEQSLNLFLALLSVLVFSSIATIKNLKDLLNK